MWMGLSLYPSLLSSLQSSLDWVHNDRTETTSAASVPADSQPMAVEEEPNNAGQEAKPPNDSRDVVGDDATNGTEMDREEANATATVTANNTAHTNEYQGEEVWFNFV